MKIRARPEQIAGEWFYLLALEAGEVGLPVAVPGVATEVTAAAILTELSSDEIPSLGTTSEGAGTTPDDNSGIRGAVRDIQKAVRFTWTDASIASMSGSSETAIVADAARRVFILGNPDVTSIWVNLAGGAAVANGAGCLELTPGEKWVLRGTNIVKAIGVATRKMTVLSG